MKSLDIYNNIKYLNIFNEIEVNINKITIDSRKVEAGDCYIGIKGEKNDGNKFFMDAFLKGASVSILDNVNVTDEVEKYIKENNKSFIVVENTVKTLGELAKYKRSLFYYI